MSGRAVSRAFASASLVFVIVAATLAVSPPAGAATAMLVRGTVRCSSGQPAVGVWVQSSRDGSGFATTSWQFPNAGGYRYFQRTVSSSTSTSTISIHVGCGGSPASWAKDLYSPNYTVGSSGRTINLACSSGAATHTVACKSAPKGPTVTYNMGAPGYCTWGAYDKWKASTGYYPKIGGDAIAMDDNALKNGFYVWGVPHVRSMVVFNRGTYGHVGWVTSVYKNSKGQVAFDYWDMNGGTLIPGTDAKTTDFGRFVKRTGKVWDSTQRFILAPN